MNQDRIDTKANTSGPASRLWQRIALLIGFVAGLTACGSATVGGGYNATTPTNVFETALFE